MRRFYSASRISFSLKTKSLSTALRHAKSVRQKLEDYWLGLRLQRIDIPQIKVSAENVADNGVGFKLSEALDLYLRLRGGGKDKVFGRTANRNIGAALNKWLKEQLTNPYQVYGFRHSLRDRLREVECPTDVVDRIGGWITSGVGQSYGKGYPLGVLFRWMSKI